LKFKVIDAVTRLQKDVENYLAHFESSNLFIRFKQSRGPLSSWESSVYAISLIWLAAHEPRSLMLLIYTSWKATPAVAHALKI